MTTLAKREAQLTARLADLDRRMSGIEAELDSHQTKDWEDMATEREGDEVLEGMGVTAQTEQRMILAALDRIKAGDYGICTKCGTTIAEERLDALPFTPFCRTCAG